MKYIVRDRDAGNIVEEFNSLEEAEKRIEEIEESDKDKEIFEIDFYEVVCRCEKCGELFYPDEINLDKYCLDCFYEKYVECDDCGKAMLFEDGDYVEYHLDEKSGDVWYLCHECSKNTKRYTVCSCGKYAVSSRIKSYKCNSCK